MSKTGTPFGQHALGRLLGTGKEAEVFAFGDGALKLYGATAAKRSAFREAQTRQSRNRLGSQCPKSLGLDASATGGGIQFRVHSHPGTHFCRPKVEVSG